MLADAVMREIDRVVRVARNSTVARSVPVIQLSELGELLLAVKRYRQGPDVKDPRNSPTAFVGRRNRKDGPP